MSIKTILFNKQSNFLGRNGEFKSVGLEIVKYGDEFLLYPITTKGMTARCYVSIPCDSIKELFEQMKQEQNVVEFS